jgi:hypothetical protein
VNKDMQQMATWAAAHGWTITRTKNDHLKWRGPEGQLVVSASTPSDHRAITAIRVRLRREGLEFPKDQHRKRKK